VTRGRAHGCPRDDVARRHGDDRRRRPARALATGR
jgi:hypothetical protein